MIVSLSAMRTDEKFFFFAVLMTLAAVSPVQAELKGAAHGSDRLEDHYAAALHFQKEGELDQAAAQYRAFLAGILGQLAVGYADLGNYAKAASYFDDALALEPNSPALRLAYATAAMELGDPAHAETLTRAYLRDYPSDFKGQAQAHQILGRALLKMNRDDDARKEFEAAVALDPTFANGYDLAVACLDLVDGKCAEQIFREMEASFGDRPAIHMQFGRAYADSDFQQQAVIEFRKVIAEDPRYPQAHDFLAAAMLEVQDDSAGTLAAEAELKKGLSIFPDDAFAYGALGKIAVSQHRYAQAEKYLRRAAALDPKDPDAFLYLGQMYYDTDRPSEAESALRQAVWLTTDISRNRYQIQRAHFLLGRLLMQRHKEAEAHAEMQIAHELLNQTLTRDKSKLAGLLDSQASAGPDGASEQARAQNASPDNAANAEEARRLAAMESLAAKTLADSYNNLGVIAATNKDYAQALTDFQHAEVWNPSLPGLDYNWGRAAFSASRFTDAIVPLAHSLRSHPDDLSIRVALGISQYMTHDYGDCIRTLEPIEGDSTSLPQVKFVYADSLVKTGNLSSGIEHLSALAIAHPEIPDVHRALGEAFALQGNKQKAITELRAAIAINANDSEAHHALGKIELDGGNTSIAVSDLEAAVRLRPDDPAFHLDLAYAYKAARRGADAEREARIYNALRVTQLQSSATSK